MKEAITKEVIEFEHKCKMEYAAFIRETEMLKHEWEKERMRIKSAEIRKNMQLKENRRFANEMKYGGE